ncbi:MAG: hypothetical protein MJE77_27700 [Proteobacteria bacterium]|nr:hypothetical protein [Pseudomonadota bacterium]
MSLPDMGFLGTDRFCDPEGFAYRDVQLHPVFYPSTYIAGNLYESWLYCAGDSSDGICDTTILHRRVCMLSCAEILSNTPLQVTGRVAATARQFPRQPLSSGTFRDPVQVSAETFRWQALEDDPLPSGYPISPDPRP